MRSFELKVKRTGGVLLAVIAFCVIFVCAPLRAKAAEVFTNGYFQYVIEDHSVKIVSYFGTQEEVTVPNMIAGNPVNEIAKDAFAGNQDVKKVNLPDTIMTIEEGAFGEGQTVVYDGVDPADIATAITQIEAGAEGQGSTGSEGQGGTGSEEQGTAGGGSQAGTGAEGQDGTGSEGQGGAQTGTGSGSEGTGSEGQGSTGAEGQGTTGSQSGTDEFTLEEFEVGTEDDDALLFANAETGASGDGAAKEQVNASAADEKAQEQKAEIGADTVAVTVGTSEVANPKSHGMVVVLIVAAAVVLMGGCAAVTYIAKKDKGQKN